MKTLKVFSVLALVLMTVPVSARHWSEFRRSTGWADILSPYHPPPFRPYQPYYHPLGGTFANPSLGFV